jgi:hypothetical protein
MIVVLCILALLSVANAKNRAPRKSSFFTSPVEGVSSLSESFTNGASCLIDNQGTSVQVHQPKPPHLQETLGLHEKLTLNFDTAEACHHFDNVNFQLELGMFHDIYRHSQSTIRHFHDDGTVEIVEPRFVTYLGSADITMTPRGGTINEESQLHTGHTSLAFVGIDQDRWGFLHEPVTEESHDKHSSVYRCMGFNAKIWTPEWVYHIEPVSGHTDLSNDCQVPLLKLTVTHVQDTGTFEQDVTQGIVAAKQRARRAQESSDDSSRKLQQVIEFTNCFTNQYLHLHSVQIGLIIDDGFFSEFDYSQSRLLDFLETMFVDTNGIYEPQLQVHVSIGDIFIGNAPGMTFNDAPPCTKQMNVSNQLDQLTAWNDYWYSYTLNNCTSYGFTESNCPTMDKNAVWFLMSHCYSGGTAWRKTLCKKNMYNSAVVNWYESNTWQVFAHELGHVFGAYHSFESGMTTTGGIMDYGDGTYLGVYQFHPLRQSDVCDGITWALQLLSTRVSNCWSVKDYGVITYRWRQSGDMQACGPCGTYPLSVEKVECIMSDMTGAISVVEDIECNLKLKPQGKFTECSSIACDAAVCGNALWEPSEACDKTLDSECCSSTCTRLTTTTCKNKNPRIDAAFSDTSGRIYLFQGSQVARYDSINDRKPATGYPKLISEQFPSLTAWTGDISAAFSTSDNVVYFFKGFSYVRYDMTTNSQLDATAIAITEYSAFGKIPWEFRRCGKVDAAFVLEDGNNAVLVCDFVYYQFYIGDIGVDNSYRPFWNDFEITFGGHLVKMTTIDAAVYDWATGKIRFFMGDQFVDYKDGQQVAGTPDKIAPMGFWSLTTSVGCTDPNCANCGTTTTSTCYLCKTGYNLFGTICRDTSYLAVVGFDGTTKDEGYVNWDQSSVPNGFTSGLTDKALVLKANDQLSLYKIDTSGYPSGTLSAWTVTIFVYPKNTTSTGQTLLTIGNKDDSTLRFVLTPTSGCTSPGVRLQVYHRNSSKNYQDTAVFDQASCNIQMLKNQWSKLTIQATTSILTITVNSYTAPASVLEYTSTFDFTIDLHTWYVGGGKFDGLVDTLTLRAGSNLPAATMPPTPAPVSSGAGCAPANFPWLKAGGIAALALFFYSVILLGVYHRVVGYRQLNDVNEEQRVLVGDNVQHLQSGEVISPDASPPRAFGGVIDKEQADRNIQEAFASGNLTPPGSPAADNRGQVALPDREKVVLASPERVS